MWAMGRMEKWGKSDLLLIGRSRPIYMSARRCAPIAPLHVHLGTLCRPQSPTFECFRLENYYINANPPQPGPQRTSRLQPTLRTW